MLDKTLGHYRILELLGEGGMGQVFLAEDTILKRRVALKVLPPEVAEHGERLERFRLEAEAAAALNHPAIVTLHSIEQADDPDGSGRPIHFLTMERVEGRPLGEAIPEGGLPLAEFYALARRLVEGLAAAHARGVIHRDIKPGNIVVGEDGRPKILDFGLAKLRDSASPASLDPDLPTALMTEPGRVLGTPAYMAPEQAEGGEVDARADLFALGAVFYEMLTGEQPFRGESPASLQAAILTSDPPSPGKRRRDLPRPLEHLVLRCLAKDPAARPASADELAEELGDQARRLGLGAEGPRRLRMGILLPAAALVVALAAFAGWLLLEERRTARSRRETLPQIERLLDEQRTFEGFQLAIATLGRLPDDPLLADLVARSSVRLDLTTEPAGAEIFYQDYRTPGTDWHPIGISPIEAALLPDTFLRLRIVKPGFETLEVGAESDVGEQSYRLVAEGEAPEGMVWVPAGRYRFGVSEPIEVPGFWLDRYELTNRAYQEFVDAGGYRRPELWKEPFAEEGALVDRDEAMARFVDSTGQPGPATWSLGRYPEGEDDLPVRGVSWYEAAAYAEFAGKRLPTLFHWRQAAPWSHRGEILLLSNFDSDGPVPVGSAAVGQFGHHDLAGNVTEWCWNRALDERRYLLGGSWTEPSYTFTHNFARPPFERAADIGFRLALFDTPPPSGLFEEIRNFRHDFRQDQPVGDEIFAVYRSMFSYDSLPLEAAVEKVDDSHPSWRRETVSFTVAYGERLLLHLFLPKGVPPPYQTVVYVPGSGARAFTSIDDMRNDPAFFVSKSGRALAWPAFSGTLERGGGTSPASPRARRDELIRRVNDLQRSVDYLLTRDDVLSDRLAYLGLSYGSEYGSIYTSIEQRFRALVFLFGGFDDTHMLGEPAEMNPWHYTPRVTAPALMVNGKSDYGVPVETGQRPMFDLLGTAAQDKRHVLLDGGHVPYDWNAVYREALGWLDRYLGPVER